MLRASLRALASPYLLLILCCLPTWLSAQEPPSADEALADEIVATGDSLEYLARENLAIYKGNVQIEYQDIVMQADEVRVNRVTGDLEAFGEVRFRRQEGAIAGDHVIGNLRTKVFTYNRFVGYFDKWLFRGEQAVRSAEGTYTITTAAITACEDWWIHARTVVREPDGTFIAHHVTYRLFGAPILYLPYVKGNTQEDGSRWSLRAGHQSDWGFYLMVGRAWALGDLGETRFTAEYRTERGLALRNDTSLVTPNSRTDLLAYGMLDQDPLTDRTVGGTEYNHRFESEDERYRLKLFHYRDFPDAGLQFRTKVDAISDNDLLLEFFKDEYRENREPATYAELTYPRERFTLSLLARPRINDHHTAVERLPELRLELPRQPLAHSGIYFQASASMAKLNTDWREYDLDRLDGARLEDYDTWRFHTADFVYLPFQVNWLNVVPRAGVVYTWYDRSSLGPVTTGQLNDNFDADDARGNPESTIPIFNYDDLGASVSRITYELGLEMSFKASLTNNDYENQRWNIDGLRHIVEPYVNYTFLADPKDDKDTLYFFDERDRIDLANFLRVGTRQRLQTRRNDQIYTLARMENFIDFHFGDEDEDDLSSVGEFGTVIELAPTDRVSLWAETLIDIGEGRMNVFNAGAGYGLPGRWSVGLSYLYRNDYRGRYTRSYGSNLTEILSETIQRDHDQNHNLRLDFEWFVQPTLVLATEHYLDLDEGRLGLQSYGLRKIWPCWITEVRLEEDGEDLQVMLLLTLKDIARASAGN